MCAAHEISWPHIEATLNLIYYSRSRSTCFDFTCMGEITALATDFTVTYAVHTSLRILQLQLLIANYDDVVYLLTVRLSDDVIVTDTDDTYQHQQPCHVTS